MKTVCGYIRVSTDDQVELSPASQKKLIKEYCAKNDYVLADVYEDLGISGKSADRRPAFRQMIAMAKSKAYDAIIVWKFSRFARNQEESIVYKSMLRKIGVDVISISEPIGDGLGGKLTEAILEIMDEYYSINLAQEVKRGMTEGARQGKIMAKAPIGYTYQNKNYVPNEYAKVVQDIFDKYVNGISIRSIAFQLNQQGLRTPRGNRYDVRLVKYVLENPVYIGKIRWNHLHRDENNHTEIHSKDDWIVADGTHQPIITQDVFDKAQERLATNPKRKDNCRVAQKHWMVGVLVCAKCGKTMAYHGGCIETHTAPYFTCRGRLKGTCTGQNTKAEWIERDFFEGLSMAISSGNYKRTRKIVDAVDPAQELKKQLQDLEKKLDRVKEAYRNGVDTLEEYKANKAIIEKERNTLSLRIEKCLNEAHTQPQAYDAQAITTLIDALKGDGLSVQEKSDALKEILEKVVYSKADDTMDFYFLA